MTSPKVGDRVKVTIEGQVGATDPLRRFVEINLWRVPIDPSSTPAVSVEVIPPPEPTWQPGDVISIDYPDRTETYARTPRGWINLTFNVQSEPYARLYLNGLKWRHIARAGKPVT